MCAMSSLCWIKDREPEGKPSVNDSLNRLPVIEGVAGTPILCARGEDDDTLLVEFELWWYEVECITLGLMFPGQDGFIDCNVVLR